MKECTFCNTTEPILKETPLVQAILSSPHKMPGHFLVMPKRHIEKPWELKKEELTDIFDVIFEIEQRLQGVLGDGFDVRQNYRPYLDQSDHRVHHVLFHVYPRYKDDYLYKVAEQYEKDLFTELDEDEHDEVAKLLS